MNIKKFLVRLCALCLMLSLSLMMHTFALNKEHYDILIKDATIVDGTGKASFKGDIAITDERIAAVGKVQGTASVVIDGEGLVASPGFIDPHSHVDWLITKFPLAENYIMQGITTVLVGNCGSSMGPISELMISYLESFGISAKDIGLNWNSFGEWMTNIEKLDKSINLASLVGHNPIRAVVMGNDWRREATAEEISKMKSYIEEAMKEGAFGFSSGVDYPPAQFANTEELTELAKVARKYGGIYVPHTRHIHSQWFTKNPEEVSYGLFPGPPEDVLVGTYRGYLEAIEIGRRANIPVHIAHYGPAFVIPQPHPDYLEVAAAKATLDLIDEAREEGIDVTFDIIPSPYSIASMSPMRDVFYSPRVKALQWIKKIPKDEFIEKLKTRGFREKIKKIDASCRLKLGMIHTKTDPYWMDCFKILVCKNKIYEGKTISTISQEKNTDALDTVFDILIEDPDTKWFQFLDKRGTSASIPVFLKHPYASPCTDQTLAPAHLKKSRPFMLSPSTYGLFPDYIATYVREKGTLSLEEAIQKATSLPADILRLKDRGILRKGAYADIVVFDLKDIRMKGNLKYPDQPPEGILYVLVNGKIVYKDNVHTGEKPGKLLRYR